MMTCVDWQRVRRDWDWDCDLEGEREILED